VLAGERPLVEVMVMTPAEKLARLAGRWTGTSRLWLSPAEEARESASTATIAPTAQGHFLTIAYTWATDGEPQDGLLLLATTMPAEAVSAVWIDSWHMGRELMRCHGQIDPSGVASVKGSYAAPPGPDWGWRIVVEPDGGETLRLVMYNVTPGGEEMLAVEGVYRRRP
jgi:hypothetical protein